MDATFVLSNCSWIMAELVRVLHDLPPDDAHAVVDSLVERRIPLVWEGEGVRRILQPSMSLSDQTLVLLATSANKVAVSDLQEWTDYANRSYFIRMLRKLHEQRRIELSKHEKEATILPPGTAEAAKIIEKAANKQKQTKPCSALADVIQPRSPYETASLVYPQIDLCPLLVLLMTRLTDSADDDGIVDDFCESFRLSRKAVVAAIKAYRHASTTVH